MLIRGWFHETQDRGDFCGRYCRLQPTGCRGRRGNAAASRLLSAGDGRLHRQRRRTHFNTAGDAVLAEFPSAVEAVRCAIEIQESLRTRNMAYPPSRQMSLSDRHHHRRCRRARRGPAGRRRQHRGAPGRPRRNWRHLHLARGASAGRQQAVGAVRRYGRAGSEEHPNPVHAYMVAMRREDGTYATPQIKKRQGFAAAKLDVAADGDGGTLAAIGVGGFCISPSWRTCRRYTRRRSPAAVEQPSTCTVSGSAKRRRDSRPFRANAAAPPASAAPSRPRHQQHRLLYRPPSSPAPGWHR